MRFSRDEAGSMGIRKEVASVLEREEVSLLLEDERMGGEEGPRGCLGLWLGNRVVKLWEL